MILAIDLGTGGCNVGLFAEDYRVAQAGYETYYGKNGVVEQEPKEWWQAVLEAVSHLLSQVPDEKPSIKGIALSGHSPSLVPVDEGGRALARSIIWQDTRAQEEARNLSLKLGKMVAPNNFDPKMLWFKVHRPDIYGKTHVFLQPKDYIISLLCGRKQIDSAAASSWFCYSRPEGKWLSLPGGPEIEKLPEIAHPWEIVGELGQLAAEELGLQAGIPVVSGGIDAFCEALGAGLIGEGLLVDVTGTSTCLMICQQEDEPLENGVCLHVIPDLFLKIRTMSSTGGALQWFVDSFSPRKEPGYFQSFLDELLPEALAGARGLIFLPYLFGERSPIWDAKARGVFFGINGQHRPPDFLQAVLEGVTFGIRQNLELIEEEGYKVELIHALGGGNSNPYWLQLKADILCKPVQPVLRGEGALTGAYLLAAWATGKYPSLKIGVDKELQKGPVYKPRGEVEKLYQERFNTYKALYPALREIMAQHREHL